MGRFIRSDQITGHSMAHNGSGCRSQRGFCDTTGKMSHTHWKQDDVASGLGGEGAVQGGGGCGRVGPEGSVRLHSQCGSATLQAKRCTRTGVAWDVRNIRCDQMETNHQNSHVLEGVEASFPLHCNVRLSENTHDEDNDAREHTHHQGGKRSG